MAKRKATHINKITGRIFPPLNITDFEINPQAIAEYFNL